MSLTRGEQLQLSKLIPRTTKVVASSVAQLYFASPDPDRSKWVDDEVVATLRRDQPEGWMFGEVYGALLLEKDSSGCISFAMYDLLKYKKRFWFELYNNIKYDELSDQFHAFEAEGYMCGFNFSDTTVAKKFFQRVRTNLPNTLAAPTNKRLTNKKTRSAPKGSGIFLNNGLINADAVPSEWKRIFRSVGIKKKELKNPKMSDIIYEVLREHGVDLESYRSGAVAQKSGGEGGSPVMALMKQDSARRQGYDRQQMEREKMEREQAIELRNATGPQNEENKRMPQETQVQPQLQKVKPNLPARRKAPPMVPPRRKTGAAPIARPSNPKPTFLDNIINQTAELSVVPEKKKQKPKKPKAEFLRSIEQQKAILKHVKEDDNRHVPVEPKEGLYKSVLDRVDQIRKDLADDADDDNDSEFSDDSWCA